MNREETKKAIAVMQAFVDGEDIEVMAKSDDPDFHFNHTESPGFNFEYFEYRVKQKPLEFTVLLNEAGDVVGCSKDSVVPYEIEKAGDISKLRAIKVVEET